MCFIPLAPISKSLWTCCVEAAVEYCRIVWDIFPQGKLIRFVVNDSAVQILNSWSSQQQNLPYLLNALSNIGVPNTRLSSRDCSIFYGLKSAIEALCECSDIQHERRTSLTENASKVLNRCRVICITSTIDNSSIKSFEEYFQNILIQQNKIAAGSDHLITVHHCHLVILNVYPNNVESQVTGHPPKDMSAILTTEVHSVKAGGQVASKLSHLILSHYNLASTTVTGIPMKEEQNASSSANYDVEIFHPSAAHNSIIKGNAADAVQIRTVREGTDYETVTLKWCTPRSCSASELQNCTAVHRITPVDVNSRPSSCLINFLLNGRSVMLEMARKSGGKMTSHLLAAHGGEIFIHALSTSRSVLEEPPSISEGCGGRVTDYRIPDFGLLMQSNKLAPLKRSKADAGDEECMVKRMRERLERQTKYWPMTISGTLIFNLKTCVEPLTTLLLQEELSDEEVVQCKQVVYNLMGLEAKHEPLQTPSMGQRGKGPKREEQYRTMWSELEVFMRANMHSEQHQRVLNCLLECRNKTDEDRAKGPASVKEERVGLNQALREFGMFGEAGGGGTPPQEGSASQGGAPTGGAGARATVIRATTDSPMSPPPHATGASSTLLPFGAGNGRGGSGLSSSRGLLGGTTRTLLDLWIRKTSGVGSRRAEFSGRLQAEAQGTGLMAKLYTSLKSEGGGGGGGGGAIE
ncbi:integrator complex subunit 13 [Hetaerina americana]|uniref:integrator complex subunit 13 n=1 Tax=Hetaerina americana TaxID=62018 RepID=UPI003A7F4242